MLKSPLAVLILLFLVVLAAGCLFRDRSASKFDETGLKYVATERARERLAESGAEQRAELRGFVQELNIVDGKVPLSLEEIVRRTLRNSLDIQVASYTPAIAETDILAAESVFDAVYFLEGNYLNADLPNTTFLNLVPVQEDTRTVSTGIRKFFATGGSITVSENLDYFFTTGAVIEPRTYTTNFMVELTQPLLRNMGFDANKAQIYIASYARNASLEQFRRSVLDVMVQLEDTYWELVFAVRDVEVRKRSLALAEEVYRKEKSREAQQMARPLEVSRARAAVTSRKAELIRAQNRVRDLSDLLKNTMNDPDPQLGLASDVLIVPADDPVIESPVIDRPNAVVTAIAQRPELQELREQIKAIEAQKRFDRNQLLPRLDLSFLWRRNAVDTNSSGAWKDQLSGDFTDYGAGLVFEVPVGNRFAESQYRRSRLELQQAMRSLDNLTQDVILEVNTAIREIETNLEEIVATREARIAAKDTLDGEQARYDVGDVTNEELLRAQRDFEEAERNELQTLTRLMVAIVHLERAKGTLLEYDNIHVLPKTPQDD